MCVCVPLERPLGSVNRFLAAVQEEPTCSATLVRQWQEGSQIYVFVFHTESFCTSHLFSFYVSVDLVSDLVRMNMENEDYNNFHEPTQTPIAFTLQHPSWFPLCSVKALSNFQTYRTG